MRASLVVAILLGAISCGSDSTTTPGSHNKTIDISAAGITFLPTIADAAVHDTVRWTFSVNPVDNLGHNVLFQPKITGAPADIATEVRSGTMSRVFDTAGEFNYVCSLHGSMVGRITVQ